MTVLPLINRIHGRLTALGLSPSRASLMAGLDRSFLRKFIQDQQTGSARQPRRASMVRLAGALKCNPDWLLSGSGHLDAAWSANDMALLTDGAVRARPQDTVTHPDMEVFARPGHAPSLQTPPLQASPAQMSHVQTPSVSDPVPAPASAGGAAFAPGPASDVRPAPGAPAFQPADWPQDVPVFMTIRDGDGAFRLDRRQPVDYVRRPPGLAHARDAYVIYVQGSGMEPRFREGEMVYLSTTRPARSGDDVLVLLTPPDPAADDIPDALDTGKSGADAPAATRLGELRGRASDGTLTLGQFNPPAEFPLENTRIQAVHRIYRIAELMGV